MWSLVSRRQLSRRSLAFALVLLLHLLLLAALILIAPDPPPGGGRDAIVTVLLPNPAPKAERAKPQPPRPRQQQQDSQRIRAPVPVVKTPNAPTEDYVLGPIPTVDIRNLPNHRSELAEAAPAAPAGGADSAAIGSGPDGKPMYKAEWQREPTDAELAFYLPKRRLPPGAWALIVCKTAPRYKVEDCRELGDSPRGSGLARAINQASWQFRVRPPTLGGEALIGAWVQILFTFGEAESEGQPPSGN